MYYFTKFANSYLPAASAIAAYVEDQDAKTVEECAQLCLDRPNCLSFNAGTPNNIQEGHCWLLADNLQTSTTPARSWGALEHYERLGVGSFDTLSALCLCACYLIVIY